MRRCCYNRLPEASDAPPHRTVADKCDFFGEKRASNKHAQSTLLDEEMLNLSRYWTDALQSKAPE
jgi:hypothetical protein